MAHREPAPAATWASASSAAAASSAAPTCPPTRRPASTSSRSSTSTQDKARTVAADFDIPAVAGSAEELAARADVDIVDIAVLPWVQPEIVPVVAAAGKHMLCQKPLAMDYATGVAEVETAEAAGVLLAVNHQMRWDAGIAASRDLVAQGALGTVTEAQIQVSVSTPLHLWAWIAESPHLDIKVHSTHYLDALRSDPGRSRCGSPASTAATPSRRRWRARP